MLQSEFMFLRVSLLAIFSAIYSYQVGSPLWSVPRQYVALLLFRSINGVIAIYGILIGFRTLPLTIFVLLLNTNTFTTAILQYFYLKIPVATNEIVCMLGCYAGIIMIAVYSSEERTLSDGTNYTLALGFFMSLVSAVAISASVVTIHETRSLHFAVIQFWGVFLSVIVFGILLVIELFQKGRWPL